MFPSGRVVPFDAKPAAGCATDLADIANGAHSSVVGQPIAEFRVGSHLEMMFA